MRRRIEGLHEADPAANVLLPDSLYLVRVARAQYRWRSRGFCLEMICADFLAGANLENGNSQILLQSVVRFFKFLPGEERKAFLDHCDKLRTCREFGSSKTIPAAASS